jgi:hypothetical protein
LQTGQRFFISRRDTASGFSEVAGEQPPTFLKSLEQAAFMFISL